MSDALEKVLQALIWAAVGTVVLPSAAVMFLTFAETYLKVEFKNDLPKTVAKVAFVTVVALEAAIIAVWIMWLTCKTM